MAGVDRECEGNRATHHHACKCREEYFRRLQEALKHIKRVVGTSTEAWHIANYALERK